MIDEDFKQRVLDDLSAIKREVIGEGEYAGLKGRVQRLEYQQQEADRKAANTRNLTIASVVAILPMALQTVWEWIKNIGAQSP